MDRSWHSLYLPTEDAPAVAGALRQALLALGYELTNPFPGGSGPVAHTWQRTVRHFVAPSAGGWTRVLGQPDPETLPGLTRALGTPLIQAGLVEDGAEAEAVLAVWTSEGQRLDTPQAFVPWLRPERTAGELARLWAGDAPPPARPEPDAPTPLGVPLPDEVQAMAGRVNPAQAERLMRKLTGRLLGSLGAGGQEAQARAMLGGGGSPWQTSAGVRLMAAMACLTVADDWREPDFEAVREAYQVARARQHHPRGVRLPGDDEALERVPNVLDYGLVYAGMRSSV